ncbi:unnamed protein product, partial [Tetraodon nigroviridis]
EIARLCYERFDQLPRRGKPEAGREWTLLAAVLRTARSAKSDQVTKEVVSLATGTKCVGRSAVSPSGDVLNDSHAEVIARRGCVRRGKGTTTRGCFGSSPAGGNPRCPSPAATSWHAGECWASKAHFLSHYLQEALYFTSVVVGACPFSQEVMDRALVTRCSQVSKLPDGFSVRPPSIIQASVEFPFSQGQTELRHRAGQGRISPCGAAISWCNVAERPLDVTANGYKQGVTKKTLGTEKARSLLCKLELFHSFLSLVSATEPSARPSSLRAPGLQTYWDYKQASQSYQQAWQQLRSQAFPLWPRGDRSLLQFR